MKTTIIGSTTLALLLLATSATARPVKGSRSASRKLDIEDKKPKKRDCKFCKSLLVRLSDGRGGDA